MIHNGLLYHQDKILGQAVSQLVVPKSRRRQVLEVAHDTHGGHMGAKRTQERIAYTFFWPSLKADCVMKRCSISIFVV